EHGGSEIRAAEDRHGAVAASRAPWWAGAGARGRRGYVTLLGGGAVTLAALVLYSLTLSPDLAWANQAADGGDLLAAAHTGGVPHPSGYPTYMMLLRVFDAAVPFGSAAFTGNLFSALSAALSSGMLFATVMRARRYLPLGRRTDDGRVLLIAPAALLAALAFAASRELWSQATVTEVYALNAFFASGVLYAAVALRRRIDDGQGTGKAGIATGLLLGVGLGNHLTLLAVAVPALLWALSGGTATGLWARAVLILRRSWPVALGAVAGLTVYLYLPVASANEPPINWGHPHTLEGFWWLVSGSLYRGYVLAVESGDMVGRALRLLDMLFSQYTAIGVLLGLAGLARLWESQRALAVSGAATVLLLAAYAVTYRTSDSYLYLIPAFMIWAVWMAVGAMDVFRGVWTMALEQGKARKWVSPRRGVLVASAALLAVVPGFSVATNFAGMDLSGEHGAGEYADAVFASVEPDSIILARTGKTIFSLWYQGYVEEPDSDVMVVSTPHLFLDWYWEDLERQYPDRLPESKPDDGGGRTDAIIDYNMGLRALYETDRSRDPLSEFTYEPVDTGFASPEVETLMRIRP
ncbi:MAG: protein O-mannosyl-transferase family, partial [Chloroflexota bacterium]